jgi:TetR/AcrR family transcriptional regulator, transcriptional repressor of aconitase
VPKVSQEHRDARREQILTAARRCFLRSGFHETSMQDLFAESGLSSGAVYGYFASKDDMIMSIVEENMADVLGVIHALTSGRPDQPLGTVLAEVLELVRTKHDETQLGPMSVLVWAEALRNPELAQRFATSVAQMRAELADAVRGYQAEGSLPEDASAEALARLFISIIPGFILQLALLGSADVADVPAAVAALLPR